MNISFKHLLNRYFLHTLIFLYFLGIRATSDPRSEITHRSIGTGRQKPNGCFHGLCGDLKTRHLNPEIKRMKFGIKLLRRRRRRNDGIHRLAVTDNINVLRNHLLNEIARRQRLAQRNMQNRLNSVG